MLELHLSREPQHHRGRASGKGLVSECFWPAIGWPDPGGGAPSAGALSTLVSEGQQGCLAQPWGIQHPTPGPLSLLNRKEPAQKIRFQPDVNLCLKRPSARPPSGTVQVLPVPLRDSEATCHPGPGLLRRRQRSAPAVSELSPPLALAVQSRSWYRRAAPWRAGNLLPSNSTAALTLAWSWD